MRSSLVSPLQLHNVILLYLSVIDTETWRWEPRERQLAIHLARKWAPAIPDIEAVVDTAFLAVRSGLRFDPEAVAGDLCASFCHDARLQLISDLGLLARAGGHLTRREAEAIALARCLLLSQDGSVLH